MKPTGPAPSTGARTTPSTGPTAASPVHGQTADTVDTAPDPDPTPVHPFGHGLSYTTFAYDELRLSASEVPTDGEVEVGLLVRNTGDRPGSEVVEL